MRVSKNFVIQEFVPESVFLNPRLNPIWFVDPALMLTAQAIRDYFNNPMTINNWHIGLHRQESGFRVPDTPTGASFSQHRFGRAIDFYLEDYSPDEIRQAIKNRFRFFNQKGLTTIEKNTPTWVHVDIRITAKNSLYEVNYY